MTYLQKKKLAFMSIVNKSRLPEGYTEVNYIEATGTQYIDTGFSPDENISVEFKVELTPGAWDSSPFMGARVGTSSVSRFYPFAYSSETDTVRTTYGSQNIVIQTEGVTVFEGTFDSIQSVINGTTYSFSGATFSKIADNNFFIFATSGYEGQLFLSHGKLYSCKISDNGILTRDFVPCLNPNNIAGLYDVVGGNFYGSSGIDDFLYG